MNTDKTSNQLQNCLNCQKSLGDTDSYCSRCGQKTRVSQISVWTLLSEFFSSILNLDSRFFKTIKHIFSPSFLPIEYMSGKRRSYINPSRFFFVTLLIHFGTITLILKNQSITIGTEDMEQRVWQQAERDDLAQIFDSLALEYSLSNPIVIDSLRKNLFNQKSIMGNDSTDFNFISLGDVNLGHKISNFDLFNLSENELISKYDIKGFWNQLFFKQTQRMIKSPKAGIQFAIGNMLWVIVFTVIFSAFFLKLLYIRHKYFIVDHLVVSMFYHSVALILLSLVYWCEYFNSNGEDALTLLSKVLLLIIPIYGFMTLKGYYKQGKLKTFLKFSLMGFFELILLSIFASLVLLISMLIF